MDIHTDLVGKFFFDVLENSLWGGYIREVLAKDDSGDDRYQVSVPNQPPCYEVCSGDFIRYCLDMAGER